MWSGTNYNPVHTQLNFLRPWQLFKCMVYLWYTHCWQYKVPLVVMDITSLATVLVLVLLLNIVSSLYTDTPTPDVNPFPEIWNKIFCEFLEDANNPINAIW